MYAAMSAQGAVQGRNDLNLVFAGTGPPQPHLVNFLKASDVALFARVRPH